MVLGNGDLKKLSREGGRNKKEQQRVKMLLLASDIKRGKAIWKRSRE